MEITGPKGSLGAGTVDYVTQKWALYPFVAAEYRIDKQWSARLSMMQGHTSGKGVVNDASGVHPNEFIPSICGGNVWNLAIRRGF
jgi:hypothetical protein